MENRESTNVARSVLRKWQFGCAIAGALLTFGIQTIATGYSLGSGESTGGLWIIGPWIVTVAPTWALCRVVGLQWNAEMATSIWAMFPMAVVNSTVMFVLGTIIGWVVAKLTNKRE